ncbi:MAG: type 1 periplasmic binding fold superfamily protein [Robiginitalea sp.]|nr:type 1 periplasmic binding fold superfamily protein [Robiginitalea sp.]
MNLFYQNPVKNLKTYVPLMALAGLFLASCSNDDDNPDPVNEEEVITTMTITLVPQGGGDTVTLQSRDLDGDGPEAPVVTVSGPFTAGTTYDGTIVLLNETETPAENITEEVEEEADEHQFFFSVASSLSASISYSNFDGNNNPLGTEFELDAQGASTGSLIVTLRHEPKKPNDGTLSDAGGETDIAQSFDLVIIP